MIDMNKKYRTRDGRAVRVLCVDREHSEYPVVALVNNSVVTYTKDGSVMIGLGLNADQFDLIEVKSEVIKWVNVYSDNSIGRMQSTWPQAALVNHADGVKKIGFLKITFVEGEQPKFEYEPI